MKEFAKLLNENCEIFANGIECSRIVLRLQAVLVTLVNNRFVVSACASHKMEFVL